MESEGLMFVPGIRTQNFFLCPALVAKIYFFLLLFNTHKGTRKPVNDSKNVSGLKTRTGQMVEDSM